MKDIFISLLCGTLVVVPGGMGLYVIVLLSTAYPTPFVLTVGSIAFMAVAYIFGEFVRGRVE